MTTKNMIEDYNETNEILDQFGAPKHDTLAERVLSLGWQPIETAPRDGKPIIGALIVDGRLYRVHDMKYNGLSFYTLNGDALPPMTHWTITCLPNEHRG